jgi:hypothetical protein
MRVAVLGCGPAGLLAAFAAKQQGAEVTVISEKRRSPIGGAQYLHDYIPGLVSDIPDGTVTYRKMGTKFMYALKVYGDTEAPTSWDEFTLGKHFAWSLNTAYDMLLAKFWKDVVDEHIAPLHISKICRQYDLVFCTVPAKLLCFKPHDHEFEAQEIRLVDGSFADENHIIYNGTSSGYWYRTSNIFGHKWTEYSVHTPEIPEGPTVRKGWKPLKTNCDCHQDFDNFVRLGRFGQWKKAVLTSDAYKDARIMTNEGGP